jgi:hypothetical protein
MRAPIPLPPVRQSQPVADLDVAGFFTSQVFLLRNTDYQPEGGWMRSNYEKTQNPHRLTIGRPPRRCFKNPTEPIGSVDAILGCRGFRRRTFSRQLGSGLGITASSWAQFWRQKNLINGGIAAWNTYAQISNIVSAARFVPEAIGNVFSAFKGDDEEDNRALLLMLAVVLVAVGAGVMTARAIILATARKSSQTVLSELQTQHAAT